ncbi:hypothetical protein [Pleomorphomonas sp. PLEO]|uniref:hypothetical protein n=1 Tax=Pleomorphomonas sp. PLEO TaxID=3239306 RepID=UPI00351F6F89
MTDRIHCSVPFCKRTRGQRKGEQPIQDGERWVCGDHWRLVPSHMRHRLTRLRRTYRKGKHNPLRVERMIENAFFLCERAAIETAGGLR